MVSGGGSPERSTGDDFRWGAHSCAFFETTPDLLDIVIPYLVAGLAINECCLWIVSPPLDRKAARAALSYALADVDAHLARGALQLIPAAELHHPPGASSLRRLLECWTEKLAAAGASGFCGLRVADGEAWRIAREQMRFEAYERAVSDAIAGKTLTVLCTYPLGTGSAGDVFAVARAHGAALARVAGTWQILGSALADEALTGSEPEASLSDALRQATSDRERAEAQLAFQASLLQHVSEAIIATDTEFRITSWNQAASAIYGWSEHEVIGQRIDRLLHTAYAADTQPEEVLREFQERGLWQGEVLQKHKDGSSIDILASVSLIRDGAGQPVGVVAVNRDITARKQAEAERLVLLDQLRHLSRRLLQAQEAERRALARELHDEIGQQLTGLGLVLSAVVQRLHSGVSPPALAEAQAQVRALVAQVRNLSLDLRPTILDDLGLLPALLWLFERYSARTGVDVRLEQRGLGGRRFATEVETAAYRIVQEALTNVARHAGVASATVRLWLDDGSLWLVIEDQGRGFDARAVGAGTTGGLSGIQERASLLGGSATIETALGLGTRLTALLPLGGNGPLPPETDS